MAVIGGVALAAAAWAWLFAARGRRFWGRSLVAGAVVGSYALAVQRDRLGDLFDYSATDVCLGVAIAAVLYGVFWAVDRRLRVALPALAAAVGDLYQLQAGASRSFMAVSVVVVGSAEEIFWRGLVQARSGFLLALAAYALVHVFERNWALVLAVVVAGAVWGGLYSWRGSLVGPVVSHVLWDLAVVVWFPYRRD